MGPNFIFIATFALFLAGAVSALWHLRWVKRLPALETFAVAEGRIRCSVVIAARNEEARIEDTIRHLLAQRGVEIEIIVVDDRSTDRTGEILRGLAVEDARLQVKRVDVLPEGWLGKCHACHVGAVAATGDWILFTDADCWLKPDVIARALRVAERDGADHVTMSPGTVIESFGAQAWHLLFLTSLASWFAGVNRDRPRSFIGIGAFNLVRIAAYQKCGGYEALRLTVVDDVKLGLLLRRAGKRTRAFLGADDVECHWGATVASMVKIMEKNYFAALDYRLGVVLAGTVFMLLVSTILALGLVSCTAIGVAAAISPFSYILPARILARRLNWLWPSAICMPFMFPVFLYTLLNSVFVALSQGGIRWRDTFYSLESLRAGNVR
jgi:cellulose synthase/poly-beta-1,6-N-acetylglucosamine synthase-like glycosyltransferase